MNDPETLDSFELRIAQFILEEARFAHRRDYLALSPQQKVEGLRGDLSVEVQTNLTEEGEDKAIVRLRAVSDKPEALYSFSVSYVAFIQMRGPRPDSLEQRLAATGGAFLMPFVREAVASLTGKGRFGPIWLPPVNFNKAMSDQNVARSSRASGAK
jgi:preprotein translocase subunit SecB